MPYNGSGTFQRAYSWTADAATPSTDYITPSRMDADANDIASALSNCINRDGQGVPTADIPWGGHKITGLADAVGAQDAVNLETLTRYIADGGVLLAVASPTSLVALPLNGGGIVINGLPQTIPAGGVTLAAPSVGVNSPYYVYLYMSTATTPVMTMEISTTGWSLDSSGRKNKSGDTTRRLIGMVATNASAQFSDIPGFRGCLNSFNRHNRAITSSVSGQAVFASTYVIVVPTVTFLTWGDEDIDFSMCGSATGSAALMNAQIFIDSASQGLGSSVSCNSTYGAVAAKAPVSLSEGMHTVEGRCSMSTGNAIASLLLSGLIRA